MGVCASSVCVFGYGRKLQTNKWSLNGKPARQTVAATTVDLIWQQDMTSPAPAPARAARVRVPGKTTGWQPLEWAGAEEMPRVLPWCHAAMLPGSAGDDAAVDAPAPASVFVSTPRNQPQAVTQKETQI